MARGSRVVSRAGLRVDSQRRHRIPRFGGFSHPALIAVPVHTPAVHINGLGGGSGGGVAVIYRVCSGSVTSGVLGDKEPAAQKQGRAFLAEGPGWPEGMRPGGGPCRPWGGVGFSSWCHGEPLEGYEQGDIWICM